MSGIETNNREDREDGRWYAASGSGSSARPWFVGRKIGPGRGHENAESSKGIRRCFATRRVAQDAADKLNNEVAK